VQSTGLRLEPGLPQSFKMFGLLPFADPLDREAFDLREEGLRHPLLMAQYQVLDAGRFPVIIQLLGLDPLARSEVARRLLEWMDARHIRLVAFVGGEGEAETRPWLWKFWKRLPPKGKAGLFLSTWYDSLLKDQILQPDAATLENRAEDINRFEKLLTDEGALLIKFALIAPEHDIKECVRGRLGRKKKPAPWKFSEEDEAIGRVVLDNYAHASNALESLCALTSPPHARWSPIAAGDDRAREIMVGEAVYEALEARLRTPPAPAGVPGLPAHRGPNVLKTLSLDQPLKREDYEARLILAQERLARLTTSSAFEKCACIIAFEGHDAAGKGGAIRRLVQGIDPRLLRMVPVAAPTDEEQAQPWLWRFWRHVPAPGTVTIFDRTWYGRVLVERVEGFAQPHEWGRAYQEIRDFERSITEGGTVLVKFWLAISAEEQLSRFKAREETPHKRHKITPDDWRNREKWEGYQSAIHDMITRTHLDRAPWIMVEANNKLFARIKVIETVCEAVEKAMRGGRKA
jgi:AMP-polyphosphate phosphotransferase